MHVVEVMPHLACGSGEAWRGCVIGQREHVCNEQIMLVQ